jgi:hypothetical protein
MKDLKKDSTKDYMGAIGTKGEHDYCICLWMCERVKIKDSYKWVLPDEFT